MTQSNVIAGSLLGGFIVFITVRGELPQYLRLFTAKRIVAVKDPNDDGGFFGLNIPGMSHDQENQASTMLINGVEMYFGIPPTQEA